MGSGMLNQLAGMGFLALAGFFYVITLYHISLILIGLRLTRGKKAPFHKGSLRNPVDLPTVSIIVPAKDEEVVIEGAIQCADALDYPRDLLEIIIVEDGSTDDTASIARRMQPRVQNLVALTGGESKGKPAALNRALNVAKGEVIAIFDCDTRYAPDLLLRMAKFFHDHSEAEIAQAIPRVADADRNVITRLNAYEMRFWYQGLHAAKEKYGLFVHLAGTGMFIKRKVFDRIGQWDEDCLTEDLDFARRYATAGGRAALMKAEVWIQPTYSSRDLFRQRRRWWTGALQVLWKHMKTPANRKLSLPMRADTITYLASPLVFLVSSIFFFSSLGFVAATGSIPFAFAGWIIGFLGTNLFLVPLILLETVLSRQTKLLLLIPGLYWYWLLQVFALGTAVALLVTRRKLRWERTPKRAWKDTSEPKSP